VHDGNIIMWSKGCFYYVCVGIGRMETSRYRWV